MSFWSLKRLNSVHEWGLNNEIVLDGCGLKNNFIVLMFQYGRESQGGPSLLREEMCII